jgi:hypothetical protein
MQRAPHRLLIALLLFALLAGSREAAATQQRVVGTVVSGEAGSPIEGAMVVLLHRDQSVARTLSASDGSFRIAVPRPDQYRIRIDRIGWASLVSAPFDVAAGATVTRRVETEVQPISLRGLEVSGSRRCQLSSDDGTATATAWEEARKALAAATWTSERELYRLTWIRYARALGMRGDRVLSEERERRRSYTPRPFRSIAPDVLNQYGYVRDEGATLVYAAPDADVLLSDSFLGRHCLSLERHQTSGEGAIALRFEPVDDARLPDVAGRIWLDEESGRLTSVEYEYVNLGRTAPLDGDEASGRLTFRELPNGTWIIHDWRIRMPLLTERRDAFGRTVRYEARGYVEEGGTVTEVASATGLVMSGSATGVHGLVLDSLGSPMADARVWIPGTELETRSDREGAFTLTEMIPGTWSIRASHSSLDLVGYAGADAEIEVEAEHLRPVRLGLPSVGSVVSGRCAGTPEAGEIGGVLAGRALDPEGSPIPNAIVRSTWSRGTAFEGVATTTDRSGVFTFCAVPVNETIMTAAAAADGMSAAPPVEVEVPDSEPFSMIRLEVAPVAVEVLDPRVTESRTPPASRPEDTTGETTSWLTSVGFDLRREQALAHFTSRELQGYDSIPQAIHESPRMDVRRSAAGRTSVHAHAVDGVESVADGNATCPIEDFYLNGRRVRQRIGMNVEALIIRRFQPRAVSGLEAFAGESAPVGPSEACGAVLFWVSIERSSEDPDFTGNLTGLVIGPEAFPVGGLEIHALPGDHAVVTDEQGAFDFGPLPPALYSIEAEIPGWGTWRHQVGLRAYAESSVVIEVGAQDRQRENEKR